MDISFFRHGGSVTVGAEDMMRCSCVGNPLQRGDGVGVGLLLVAHPALVLPVNPSSDPVLQLPKCIWSPLCHATNHRVMLVRRVKKKLNQYGLHLNLYFDFVEIVAHC